MKNFFLFCVIISILSSCGGTEGCQDPINTSGISMDIEIIRLEQEMFQLKKDKNAVREFLKKYPDFTKNYMHEGKIPDSIVVDQIYRVITEKYMDTVYRDVQNKWKDMVELRQEFEDAFKHIKYYYPQFKTPKIYTVITGLNSFFGQDLYVSEDMIVISLEFFLGKDARYRPPTDAIPDYIWKTYHPKAIVSNCVKFISSRYNRIDMKNQTTLADMIYYGKSYYFVKTMMPCMPDSVIIGYTNKELRSIDDAYSGSTTDKSKAKENRAYLWNHLIEKKVLFSTSEFVKRDYLNPAPYVAIIGKGCPGRIAQWFGWRIVQNYAERNSGVSFTKLMANESVENVFNQSKYQGQ